MWIVQLHRGATDSKGSVLVPGNAKEWAVFEAAKGLDELRRLLDDLPAHAGVRVEGEIGITSHIADLLRKSKRPARLSKVTKQPKSRAISGVSA
jgi:hypothetical protein